jgi:hypothetical protein
MVASELYERVEWRDQDEAGNGTLASQIRRHGAADTHADGDDRDAPKFAL